MIVWVIGLSGAGKTTLCEAVVAEVRKSASNVVLLDGDVIREAFGNDLGHTMDDRRRNAVRIMHFCRWLEGEGIHVVCAILSLFPEHRAWMRENVSSYYEVYIDTPLEDMKSRDVKGLYGRYARGEVQDVAGLDIEFVAPDTPDLLIMNDNDEAAFLANAKLLAQKVLSN